MSPTFLRHGFLPETDPLLQLPEQYRQWDELASELPDLLTAGRARYVLERLPLLDTKGLTTRPERERALGVLSVFGHAAVHESWRQGSAASMPQSIAVPLVAVAKSIGRFPVLAYASHGLNNWRRLDQDGPIALGNLAVLRNFFGGLDESWFVMTHIEMEASAAPLVDAVVSAQNAIETKSSEDLGCALCVIADTIPMMSATLRHMRKNCDPHIFFNRIQPFMQGMKDVIYEGVTEFGNKPQNFPGGSGAQSTLLPLLDAALGVWLEADDLIKYLRELRRYMPHEHKSFLSRVESGHSIRDYVLRFREDGLVERYNRCIEELGRFRAEHLEILVDYIQRPAQQQASSRGELGIGSLSIVGYLKKHREETFAHRLT